MCPPTPKCQGVGPIADEVDERVDVREVGGDRESGRAQRRFATESRFGDGKSGEGVGEVSINHQWKQEGGAGIEGYEKGPGIAPWPLSLTPSRRARRFVRALRPDSRPSPLSL